jgi:hypothetical protein
MRSTADAIAVIESRCDVAPHSRDADEEVLPSLDCDGEVWEFDPDDLVDLPKPEDLFDVHLAD